jgi:SAM-dependent methyltransferase
MDPRIYNELILQENTHWWFVSRRAIAYTLLRGITLSHSPLILDAGCGSGGNLAMLSTFGSVFGMEMHEQVLARAKARHIGQVEHGKLPGDIPFPGQTFDVVTLFDVLEHIKDDKAALDALVARMNPGAVMCLTVPAFPWLYSRLDREHHHFRRYTRRELIERLNEAGLAVQHASYWNCLLFPIAVFVRLLENLNIPPQGSLGSHIPSKPINKFLRKIVSAERYIIPHFALPFGLSLIVIARKL